MIEHRQIFVRGRLIHAPALHVFKEANRVTDEAVAAVLRETADASLRTLARLPGLGRDRLAELDCTGVTAAASKRAAAH